MKHDSLALEGVLEVHYQTTNVSADWTEFCLNQCVDFFPQYRQRSDKTIIFCKNFLSSDCWPRPKILFTFTLVLKGLSTNIYVHMCTYTHIHAPPSTQCHVSRTFWERLGPSPSVCPLLPSAHCSTPSLHSFTWNFPSLLDHNPYVHYYFHLSITNNLWYGGASNKLWGKKRILN